VSSKLDAPADLSPLKELPVAIVYVGGSDPVCIRFCTVWLVPTGHSALSG
jgi:hypothetical protein